MTAAPLIATDQIIHFLLEVVALTESGETVHSLCPPGLLEVVYLRDLELPVVDELLDDWLWLWPVLLL